MPDEIDDEISEELGRKLDSIHSRLFMCYTMLKMGRAHLIDPQVFINALNELEHVYSDIPDEVQARA